MSTIKISHPTRVVKGIFRLPGSKSESNRALIINALSGANTEIQNLSVSRDTQTMLRLLNSTEKTANVIDAGTTMRFLLAYFAATGQNKILTGTERMCLRPLGILANALEAIGFEIKYLGQKGYPPAEVTGKSNIQNAPSVKVRSDVSSQFISALLMIAPTLPGGLCIELENTISSKPYIDMTLSIMKHYGIKSDFNENEIFVAEQEYKPAQFSVEPDWSAASYWFSIAALADEADIFLEGLHENSFQGDSVLCSLMENFGITSAFNEKGLHLTKSGKFTPPEAFNFLDCPDLAQTIAVVCAALNSEMDFTGIESLSIKETDRTTALNNELKKFGCTFSESNQGHSVKGVFRNPSAEINTYDDHRMAMAFAPLALMCNEISIQHPEVVAKSYPGFWEDLKKAGFIIEAQ